MMKTLCIADIISVVSVRQRRGDTYHNPHRACRVLIWTVTGEMVYRQGTEVCTATAGTLLYIPEGADYQWHCKEDYCSYVINFTGHGGTEGMYCLGKGNFADRLARMADSEDRLRRLAEVYAMLSESLDCKSADICRKEQLIAPSLCYMQQNFHLPLTTEQLAGPSHISTVYFRKLFTELYGMPPMEYLIYLRLTAAKRLLLEGESVGQVAEKCGWSSLYSFSGSFKRREGCSPREFVSKYQRL